MDENTTQDPTAVPQQDPMTPNPVMPGGEEQRSEGMPTDMPISEGEGTPEEAPTE